jgi:hypothetical protein
MRRPVRVKWVLSLFCGTRFFLPPSGHCRHASIRTLEERFVSLGARWAFSVQPVLPSVRDLVQNQDLVEDEYHKCIVGYICKIIERHKKVVIAQLNGQ